jgi:hypothetical protein
MIHLGGFVEQHPVFAIGISFLPLLLPNVGMGRWILGPLLHLLGFGLQGPVNGTLLYIVAVLSSTSL